MFVCVNDCTCSFINNHKAEECEPDGLIRLVGFDSARAGVAQVCKDGVWGRVCAGEGYSWSTRNSIVVCRQLGFPDAIGFSTIDR